VQRERAACNERIGRQHMTPPWEVLHALAHQALGLWREERP
jgi:hypothetical protein